MIWVNAAAGVASWAAWFFEHRNTFDPVLKRLGDVGDLAQGVITNPQGFLRRIGNTIVFGQADGGPRVMAFIEQTAPQIGHIEQAVDGLQAGQALLSASLGTLQTLSMVTLGLTALTPIVLGAQFIALGRRLGNESARFHKKFDAARIADLRTGLDLLRQGQEFQEVGDRPNCHHRITAALPDCIRSMKYFGELLGNELNGKKVDRHEVRLLARHLTVAVNGVASCQIGLEQDRHAFAQSGGELKLLGETARLVFHATVAKDPLPFMIPAMRAHGVTIDFMAEMYQQARDAGALDPTKDSSPSAWFEEHRTELFKVRKPWLGWDTKTLRRQLGEALGAIEETNRVVGLSRMVEEVRRSGQTTLAVMEQNKKNMPKKDDGEYLVWGID